MSAPLSRNVNVVMGLTLATLAGVGLTSWLGHVAWWWPWVNTAAAMLLSAGIRWALPDFKLGHGDGRLSVLIPWVMLTVALNLSMICLPGETAHLPRLLAVTALLVILRIVASTWQDREAAPVLFVAGLVLGWLSCLLPSALKWLLLMPAALWHMRSLSARNAWSIVTGTLFGIWVAYCVVFFIVGEGEADGLVMAYGSLLRVETPKWPDLTLTAWAYVAYVVLLLLIYCPGSMLLKIAGSVKARAVVVMVATLCVVVAAIALLDLDDLPLYVDLLVALLSVLLAVHVSDVHPDATEWWMLLLLISAIVLGIMPLAFGYFGITPTP